MSRKIRTMPTTDAYRNGWDIIQENNRASERKEADERIMTRDELSMLPVEAGDIERARDERLWERFMDRLAELEGFRPTNFLGDVKWYKKVFMGDK